MILKQHSDASYNNKDQARSSYGGYFFLGWKQKDHEPLQLNGALLAEVNVLKLVAASAAESELGALFKNMQRGVILRLKLQEMGHPQPPTDVWVDNTTTHGIANSTVKRQRSRAMNMRYFWIIDQVLEKLFRVRWAPGLQNLADYFTKHHPPWHHCKVRPYYVHMPDSRRCLASALSPSELQGCADSCNSKWGSTRN